MQCELQSCYTSWPISLPEDTSGHRDVCPQRDVCTNDVKQLKHLLNSLNIMSNSAMDEKWLEMLFSDKHSLWAWHSAFIPLTTHLKKKKFSVWWHIEAGSFAKLKELEEPFHFEQCRRMGHRECYVSTCGGQAKLCPSNLLCFLCWLPLCQAVCMQLMGPWQMFAYCSDTHTPTKINLFWQGGKKLFFFFSLT